MPRYKSHPVEIEAWEFIPRTNVSGMYTHESGASILMDAPLGHEVHWQLWVDKSKSWCDISERDFIIKEPDGVGFYPCARDIFLKRYYRTDD
jgi:hypothetical protein